MPKKKGKGGGEKKEEKKEDAFVPRIYPGERDNWMIVEFKLINWKFMNFRQKLREDTRIFTIKNMLRERHGEMDDLKICFKSFTESNEVHDDMLSLLDLGFKGEQIKITIDEVNRQVLRDESDLPVVTLLYDYKPATATVDPILLFTPN